MTSSRLECVPELRDAVLARVPMGDGLMQALPGWDDLSDEERSFAAARKPLKQREFVAGRAALRLALSELGIDRPPTSLPEASGAPMLPSGVTASITHKEGMAFALARPLIAGVTVGLDSEWLGGRDRSGISRKVLRPSELKRWKASGSEWRRLLELFATKEAIYKALYPHVPRYIGFDEAEIDDDGRIQMHLREGEGPFELRGRLRWEGQRVLAFVEASPMR